MSWQVFFLYILMQCVEVYPLMSAPIYSQRSDKKCCFTFFGLKNGGKPPNGNRIFYSAEWMDKGRNSSTSTLLSLDSALIESTKDSFLTKWRSLRRETRTDIILTALSFSLSTLVRCFFIEPRYIPSLSM